MVKINILFIFSKIRRCPLFLLPKEGLNNCETQLRVRNFSFESPNA